MNLDHNRKLQIYCLLLNLALALADLSICGSIPQIPLCLDTSNFHAVSRKKITRLSKMLQTESRTQTNQKIRVYKNSIILKSFKILEISISQKCAEVIDF